ncbi:MAG: HD domain-containing phosphohydrolase [Dissulfurispiraceae bacterium]|jgi:response regulator RpfG family c-di-GMP phosphodiesterase|nr:HD domain-containing phosphohydrolase [Dissulfurispiraceae bacterium]
MASHILCVDDEINILYSLERLLATESVKIIKCTNPFDAIDVLENTPVSVIISDNYMPFMNGLELLQRARELQPDTFRILITAYADFSTAIDAINKGEVYRFVTKPWNNDDLVNMVHEAVQRYDIAQAMKRADEAALLSLAQAIELKDKYTKGHCDRVAEYAIKIAKAMELPDEWIKNIRQGSWLHDCGKIGVPEALLNYNGPLSEDEMRIVEKHPVWGAELAQLAQLSRPIANIITYHHERYDGTGYPNRLKDKAIPLEARIVAVADTYDAMTTDRPYRKKISHKEALQHLREESGKAYDPEITDIFISLMTKGL